VGVFDNKEELLASARRQQPKSKRHPQPKKPVAGGLPKDIHWGVDSVLPIPTLWDRVKHEMGQPPEFWGRYLHRFALQASEIDFLRRTSPKTRLVLVYNQLKLGFFQDDPPDPDKEHKRGETAAFNARSAVESLETKADTKIPQDVWIYVNVEKEGEFPHIGIVSPDWILGWWKGMHSSRFQFGGIYGNVSEFNPKNNIGFIGKAYMDAQKAKPQSIQPPLWGQFPHIGKAPPEKINKYAPHQPPEAKDAVRIWQYFAETKNGGYDTNLATQEAFDRMWQPTSLTALEAAAVDAAELAAEAAAAGEEVAEELLRQ
jgi:hypothetical protein